MGRVPALGAESAPIPGTHEGRPYVHSCLLLDKIPVIDHGQKNPRSERRRGYRLAGTTPRSTRTARRQRSGVESCLLSYVARSKTKNMRSRISIG